jgi:AraC-like DNA-binding protein
VSLAPFVLGYVCHHDLGPEAEFPGRLFANVTFVHGGSRYCVTTDEKVPRLALSGVRTQSFTLRHEGNPEMTNVLFWPGRWAMLLGVRADEYQDQYFDMSDTLPQAEYRSLTEQLEAAQSDYKRIEVLEAFLQGRLERLNAVDLAFSEATKRALMASTATSVVSLAEHMNLTPKTLQRRWIESFGIAPKPGLRIARVYAALRQLRDASRPASLVDVAYACGFADQSHLTRDLAAITGSTPGRLRHLLARPRSSAVLGLDPADPQQQAIALAYYRNLTHAEGAVEMTSIPAVAPTRLKPPCSGERGTPVQAPHARRAACRRTG